MASAFLQQEILTGHHQRARVVQRRGINRMVQILPLQVLIAAATIL